MWLFVDLSDSKHVCLLWCNMSIYCGRGGRYPERHQLVHTASVFVWPFVQNVSDFGPTSFCLLLCITIAFQHFASELRPQLIWKPYEGCVTSCTIGGSSAPLSPASPSKFCLHITDRQGCVRHCLARWNKMLRFITDMLGLLCILSKHA